MDPYDIQMLPPGEQWRQCLDKSVMGLEMCFKWAGNGKDRAGKKADKRYDKQVEIAYDAAKDQHEYASDSQELAYNNAVLTKEIQQKNLTQQIDWQEETARRSWDHEVEQREAEFNSQVAAYNKSERLYGAQVGLNKYARSMADASAEAVRDERLTAIGFEKMGADLTLGQTKADIAQQRASLNIGRAKQRSEISQQQMAATLQRQQQRAQAAFGSERQLVELMQAAGKADARGQSGRTAQKNIQAIMATGGRAQAQLADQITRGDSAYNLTMMGLDKSLIYGEAEIALAQTALTTKGAYADLTYGLGAEQREASKISARAAYGRALDKSEFDEYGANLAADAKRMTKPGMAPLPPKPLELPRAILVDPMIPLDIPKPRKGAGSMGVGRAQGAAADTAAGINMATQLVSAALGGWVACDMRVKHEVALLEYTEVNDALAMLAFAVKELREHS